MIAEAAIILAPDLVGFIAPDLVDFLYNGSKKKWTRFRIKKDVIKILNASSNDSNNKTENLYLDLIINKYNSKHIIAYLLDINGKEPPAIIFNDINLEDIDEEKKKEAIDESIRIFNKIRHGLFNNSIIYKIVDNREFQGWLHNKIDELETYVKETKDISKETNEIVKNLQNSNQQIIIISRIPEPVNNYVQRDEMERLKNIIPKKNTVFIQGQSGIGKSELCRAYARYYRKENSYEKECPVVWLKYERDLKQTVADNNDGVRISGLNDDDESIDKRYESRINRLCLKPKALVIIDNFNVISDESLGKFCEGEFKKIFITRNPKPNGQIPDLTIGVLPLESLKELFYSSVSEGRARKLKEKEQDVEDLIKKSQGNTLLTILLAKSLECSDCSISELISNLETGLRNVKGRPEISRDVHYEGEKSVYEHVAALFELSDWSDADKNVLRMLSLMPTSGISKNLFKTFTGMDEKSFDESLGRISARGFIEYGFDEKNDNTMIFVHSMIAEVLREEFKPDFKNCKTFMLSMFEFASNDDQKDRLKRSSLLPMLINSYEMAPENPELRMDWEVCISSIYEEMGRYSDALEYLMKSIDFRERSSSPQNIATTYSNIGVIYGKIGRYGEALEYYEKCKKIREKVLPADHPDLAKICNNIGLIHSEMRRYNEALEYLDKSRSIMEKVLPADHPDLATIYNNIGTIYDSMRRYNEALEYYENCRKIREKVLPADHPDLATIYNNIGSIYGKMGKYNEALEYYENCRKIREKALPADHPDLAIIYNNIGDTYYSMRKYDEALEYYEKCKKIREKVLPADHPDLAKICNNIGSIYDKMGRYDEALEYYEKCKKIREKVLSADHPDLAATYSNIGIIYYSMGRYDEALEYYEKCINIMEKVLSADHPDLATIYNNIGGTYYSMGRYDKALEYSEKSMNIMEKVLSADHPDLAITYSNIGSIYDKMGRYDKAKNYNDKIKVIIDKSNEI